jgi:hypothetical protein
MHPSLRSVVRSLACVAVLAVAVVAPADAIIRVRVQAPDPACAVVSPGTLVLHIIADIGVIAIPGIQGAHWRLNGLPDVGFTFMTLNPSATSSGDPETGVTMEFDGCQPGPEILLATVMYTPYDGGPLALFIDGTPCPQLTLCNTQPPTVCVAGGTACVNNPECCTVGVAPASWSAIKTLYE